MVFGGKFIAVLILIALLFSTFGDIATYILLGIFGFIVLWYIVRFFADIYWWKKDKDEW